MLACIESCVKEDKPVQLTLMAFPFKVPNPAKVGPRKLPDLAELTAILRFQRLNSRIKMFYQPDLQIHIIHDGSYICDIFGLSLIEVRQYESYFRSLIKVAGADEFVRTYDFVEIFDRRVVEIEQNLDYFWHKTWRWWHSKRGTEEWIKCFAKTVGMINLRELAIPHASRLTALASSGELPADYQEFEHRIHDAMLLYHLRDSLLHSFDPRPQCFANAIHVTTQERPNRLAIWLIERGRSQLPWHGVGITDQSGQPSVALAERVVGNVAFEPVFIEQEATPFLYLQTRLTS